MNIRNCALSIICLSMPSLYGATVTINPAKEYQIIEGLGGFGAKTVWWSGDNPSTYYDDAWWNTIYDDLGVTIIRDVVPPSLSPSEGQWTFGPNSDPTVNEGHAGMATHIAYLKAAKIAADARGIPVKFIASVWSPPKWMKYIGSVVGYGDTKWNRVSNGLGPFNNFRQPNLDPEKGGLRNMYPDLADYLVKYIKAVKTECGIDLYALSPQNEPDFSQGFASCVYSAEQLRDLICVLGPKIKAAGLSTKIFTPDEVTSYFKNEANLIGMDTGSGKWTDILAFHGYMQDGATAGGPNVQMMQAFGSQAARLKKQLWMTETSGYTNDWSGSMSLGMSILSALRYGQLNAWVFWTLSGDGDVDAGQPFYSLCYLNNGVMQKPSRYYISKQFYKYIRPGARMVGAVCPDSNSVVSAVFTHRTEKTMTIILGNPTASSQVVTLSGSSLPASFKVYQTTKTDNCADKGSVTTSITLPASSMTTLHATNYTPPAPVAMIKGVQRAQGAITGIAENQRVRIFSASGQLIRTLTSTAQLQEWNSGIRDRMHSADQVYFYQVTASGRQTTRAGVGMK